MFGFDSIAEEPFGRQIFDYLDVSSYPVILTFTKNISLEWRDKFPILMVCNEPVNVSTNWNINTPIFLSYRTTVHVTETN